MRVTVAVFSPRGATKKYACMLAECMTDTYNIIELTNPEIRQPDYYFTKEDLVIFAAPVYFGRIPQVADGIFDRITGEDALGVFLVTYGNRDYEDALLELAQIAEGNGFIGVGAAAYVAPHCLTKSAGYEHPTLKDRQAIEKFAERIQEVVKRIEKNPIYFEQHYMEIRGNFPYRQYGSQPFLPVTDERKCTRCGICIQNCPAGAITLAQNIQTDEKRCISCTRCMKECPAKARIDGSGSLDLLRYNLEQRLSGVDHEPEHFYLNHAFHRQLAL